MPYMNQVILMGHLGKDAETRSTGSGNTVTSFTLATSERYKDKQSGEWKEKTSWHSIVAWKLHEKTAAQLTKGAGVLVVGKLDTRSYEKDGQKKYITEVVAADVKLLNPQKSGPRQDDSGDDLPF
jgi:single-strand DNA-binding protein